MLSDASICFTPRGALGRMDAEGGVASTWRVRRACLAIDFAIASSTGALTLLTRTISIAGDDAPSRSPNLR
jgi:hypothetical protein